ncbi:hypothetical protein [Natronobeatus ordinarius]|uniref:hypothetical protein n=1 Tax=Natronobeatus ordinarius TaxID=2963433 RepID=UPI0020CCD607|nr:hypothetical protein [Natronobeatus ordinarius]
MPDDAAGETHLDRFEIHKRIRNRLERAPFVSQVDARPSPMRPTSVRATIDTTVWFGEDYRAPTAILEVEWRPRPARDWFRIQYTEADATWSCGWHQDGTHDDLGPNHFQVDHEGWDTSHREPAAFDDPNPMAVLERCLEELESRIPELPDGVGGVDGDSG